MTNNLNNKVEDLKRELWEIAKEISSIELSNVAKDSDVVHIDNEETIVGKKKFHNAEFKVAENEFRPPLTSPHSSTTDKSFLIATTSFDEKSTAMNEKVFMKDGKLFSNSQEVAVSSMTFGKVFKTVDELGLTPPTTVLDILNSIITNNLANSYVIISNDNFNNISDTPTGYGCLEIVVPNDVLKQVVRYRHEEGSSSSINYETQITLSENRVTYINWLKVATQNYVDLAVEQNSVGKFYENEDGKIGEIFNDYESNIASSYSHAEGKNNKAVANCSHAEGVDTRAGGYASHTEGYNTYTYGYYSHASGANTTAYGYCQTVIGTNNAGRDDTYFEVGNGQYVDGSLVKSNALESFRNGDLGIGSGRIIKCTEEWGVLLPTSLTEDETIATQKYVENLLSSAPISKKLYDLVINSQAEFEDFYTSLDSGTCTAKSVLFVGDGGTLEFTRSDGNGLAIPETLYRLEGINNAIITISNFAYNSTTNAGAIWYASTPTSSAYCIRNLHLKCSNTTGTVRGFVNCLNLTNCNSQSSSAAAIGFINCVKLINCIADCSATGSTTTTIGFTKCNQLVNCKATTYNSGVNFLQGVAYAFSNCNQIANSVGYSTSVNANAHGFNNCSQIVNSIASGITNGATTKGFGFNNCDYISNCKEGDEGNTTALFNGASNIAITEANFSLVEDTLTITTN